jgi:type IV secretory pathway VirB10-like protein
MANPTERTEETKPPANPGAIQDFRVKPRGVLPRHVQMWLMVGVAIVILAIILFTGHPQPLPRPQAGTRPAQPTLVPPDRVRSYEQQLASDLAREQQAIQQSSSGARATKPTGSASAQGGDPTTDDQRRREYQSLFADNVALSRRPADRQPYAERRLQEVPASSVTAAGSPDIKALEQLLAQSLGSHSPTPRSVAPTLTPPATTPAAPTPTEVPTPRTEAIDTPTPPKETAPIAAGGGIQRLLEGTVIETVLLNRLDGTFAGPVECLVTTPVYSHDRQSVVIPAGARVLGSASPVQTWGDSRLAVSFHRLVMPDGRTYSLDRFKGLGQIGDTGLKDSVNRHYLQVFGASLAIGALSGLAQYGSRSSSVDSYSFGDSYRQATGSSLAASAGRVLDRYLNVLPTITIREGYRIKVYLTNDLQLPPYAAAS